MDNELVLHDTLKLTQFLAEHAMSATTLASVLRSHSKNLALVIGNGVNRYGGAARTNSWNELLLALYHQHLNPKAKKLPRGVSPTEFYDLLELQYGTDLSTSRLQHQFCQLMQDWKPYDHHRHIVSWAIRSNCPLLTTNFERTLSEAGGCKLLRMGNARFTDYYPWDSYYGMKPLNSPSEGFGIWHINGMERYARSIRLGLTHYVGSAHRARHWMHRGSSLFSGDKSESWGGAHTWISVIFEKPLAIFGIALEESEVFLRWLLIERARFYKKFPEKAKAAWYFYVGEKKGFGKRFFLKGVGVEPVSLKSYDDLYAAKTWPAKAEAQLPHT